MPKKKDNNGNDVENGVEAADLRPIDAEVVNSDGNDVIELHPEDANINNGEHLPLEEVLTADNVKPWTTGDEDPKDPQYELVPVERIHPEDCGVNAINNPPVELKGIA